MGFLGHFNVFYSNCGPEVIIRVVYITLIAPRRIKKHVSIENSIEKPSSSASSR